MQHTVRASKSGGEHNLIRITTGKVEIDAMADLLLVFPENAHWLSKTFSLQYLLPLMGQAQDRRRGQEAIKEKQQEADRKAWEKNEQAIRTEFQQMGVGMPFF